MKKKKPQVVEIRVAKSRKCKIAGVNRMDGNALVIKTEQSKYLDVLRTMRSDARGSRSRRTQYKGYNKDRKDK